MGIFFRFGHPHLPVAGPGEELRQYVVEAAGRKQDRIVEALLIGCHGHDVETQRLRGEPCKTLFTEGANDLAHTVGPKIQTEQGVASPQAAVRGDHCRQHELIAQRLGIGRLQRVMRRMEPLPLAMRQHVVGQGGAVPSMVAIHGVIAPGDRGDFAHTGLAHHRFYRSEILRCHPGARIAAIGDGVISDLLQAD